MPDIDGGRSESGVGGRRTPAGVSSSKVLIPERGLADNRKAEREREYFG